MASHRVKIDYNNMLQQIDEFMCASANVDNERIIFGIGLGLNLLTEYIKQIAVRSIELNDEVLIELLKDMCILKKLGGDE